MADVEHWKKAIREAQARLRLRGTGICPLCMKGINEDSFRDALSRREYGISGMCQECQDKIFTED